MTSRNPEDSRISRVEIISQLRRGRPLGEVARDYGVMVADLCRWIAETVAVFENATFAMEGNVDEEIRRLRLENDCLRKQRDFYRKAAGIVTADKVTVENDRSDFMPD